MRDLLLINPPSAFTSYCGTKLNAVVQSYPLLSLAYLAAVVRENGFKVAILDLGIESEPYQILEKTLDDLKPKFVGITCTTPLFFEVADLSYKIRERLGSNVKLIMGGPHATALPEEALEQSAFDIMVIGEGEETLLEIVQGKELSEIKGIYYKEGESIFSTPPRPMIENLDILPFPALDLFDIKRYKCARLINRKTPMSNYMTSRGCVYDCTFCNKNIFGRRFRARSAEKVVEDMEYMLKMGIKEIRIVDDQFTTNMPRAKRICQLIIEKGLKFPWTLAAGLRVDCIDEEFLRLARKAGLYQTAIGFESGDQKSLDSINKGITIEQSIRAMKMLRRVGIEVVGFFMFGLPADTEESLKKTTNFALKLMPDLAKVTTLTPFPGTKLFKQFEEQGLIKSRNWSLYNLHRAEDIYNHPNLSHKILDKYYNDFYRRFYLNPRYLCRRLIMSLKNRTFFTDVYYGLQTFFPTIFPAKVQRKRK